MNISDKYFMEGETGLFPFYRTEPSAGHKSAGTETVRTGDTPVLEAAREKVVELVREETGDILFREAGESGGEKSLVGLHNISEERLLKALRLGGFANPSAAVIDISRQTHEGYGEISLVLPASMIDRHSGRNAGTWSQDAWTPVYPQIERQFGGTGGDRASGDIMSVPEEMRNETRRGINSWMDGRSADRLAYLYLHEQGKAPGLVRREARYPESLHNAVRDIMGDNSALYDVSAGKRSELLGLYIRENFSGDRTAYGKELQGKMIRLEEKISSRANPDSLVVRRARERLDALRETGYDYRELADFTENVLNDAAHAGCADDAGTTLKGKYSINSLVYWVTYVHNVVYSFYRSMIYCYINSTQRCAGSIVIDIIPTNGADKRKFFPFAPYFPVTNVIKRYFYPYFPAIIGIKGYSFPYFPYLSGIMKIKTALYSLFSRLDWHKTVVFPCLGEIYEGIRSLSWEIPVT